MVENEGLTCGLRLEEERIEIWAPSIPSTKWGGGQNRCKGASGLSGTNRGSRQILGNQGVWNGRWERGSGERLDHAGP